MSTKNNKNLEQDEKKKNQEEQKQQLELEIEAEKQKEISISAVEKNANCLTTVQDLGTTGEEESNKKEKKKNSVAKNYVFNLIYQMVLILVPLIVTPYISRVLQPNGVGQYSFCFSIITYFTLFASLGFELYGQREVARYQNDRANQSKVFCEVYLCRFIPCLIALLINIALILSGVFGDNSTLMWVLCLNILSIGVDVVFFFQGNEEFGKILLRNLIIKVLGTASIFVFVKTIDDVWIYALINSLTLVLASLSLIPVIFKRLQKVNIKDLRPFKHLKGAFVLFIPALAVSLYTVLDKTLIGVITGLDAENGYFEQAEKIVKIAMTIITCLSAVMIPRNTAEIKKGNFEKVKNNIYLAFNFVWLIGIPLVIGIIFVADNFIPWFLGQGFESCSLLIKILAPLTLIIGASNILGLQYIMPHGRDKQYTISIIVGACFNCLVGILLIYFYQSLGACVAACLAELCVTLCMFLFTKKELSFKKIFKSMLKPFIAGIVMGIVLFFVCGYFSSSILNTVLIVCIGGSVYLMALLLLKEKMIIGLIKRLLSFKVKNNKD